jgi:hypothetical protein
VGEPSNGPHVGHPHDRDDEADQERQGDRHTRVADF